MRALLGLALALFVSFGARRAGALTASGAVAATVVGALSVVAGWSWAVVIIGYFVVSSALSHLGRAAKERRTSSIVAKHGPRDAWQVVSNGGVIGKIKEIKETSFIIQSAEKSFLEIGKSAIVGKKPDK